MLLRYEQSTIVEWVGYDQVCRNARFVFDQPFRIDPDDFLELKNGCFYLITNGIKIPMHGRWDR